MTEGKSPVAELLTTVAGVDVTDTDGGFLVRDDGVRRVEVLQMLYNWRVARTEPHSRDYDRAWCYYGTDLGVLLRAVLAAAAWDGADGTAPDGWDKDAMHGAYA